MVHFAHTPDPLAHYRGMSWLTPIVREVVADSAATRHKLKFFENGATPNMLVKSPVSDPEVFKKWVSIMEEKHAGTANAYRTMYLGAGADATVVGTNFQQLDFKVTQGAGESRIATAGGVHPTIVGLSEGLQGSSLNAGNFGQSKRAFSDISLRSLWRSASGAFANVIDVPDSAELWYDARDVPFLQEDQKDAASIRKEDALTIESLVRAGFFPESAQQAVAADDYSLLKHTGLVSVQLQPPGSENPAPTQENPDV
jgi:phage portal protein BeeE